MKFGGFLQASSSRALGEGVMIQAFLENPQRPGWPRQALTACLAMTNQHLVSFINCLALIFVEIGMTKIPNLLLTSQKLRIVTEAFFNAFYNRI